MILTKDSIIPSVSTKAQLIYAVEQTNYEYVMIKMGDITTISRIVAYAHKNHKKVMVHLDSLKGVAKDKYGVSFLKKIGVDIAITMKAQHIKMLHEVGIEVALGCFVVDSSALKQTILNANNNKPDAIFVMPMTVPDEVFETIRSSSSVPIYAGGLGISREIIEHALSIGVRACAVTDPDMFF